MQNLLKHLFLPGSSGKMWSMWWVCVSLPGNCVCEDEFNIQISNSSYLYPCQGPYCPSSVSPPPQPVPWAVVAGSTEYKGCAAIKQPKGAPGKALVCVGSSHRSALFSLWLWHWWILRATLRSCGAGGPEAYGWMAVSLFRMASGRCAGSLFWVSVSELSYERDFSKVCLRSLLTVPLEIWIFPTCL